MTIVLSRLAQLFQYDRYRLWIELATYSAIKTDVGADQPEIHDSVGRMRNDD